MANFCHASRYQTVSKFFIGQESGTNFVTALLSSISRPSILVTYEQLYQTLCVPLVLHERVLRGPLAGTP